MLSRIERLFENFGSVKSKDCIFWACGGVTGNLWYDTVTEAGYRAKYKIDRYKAGQNFRGEVLIGPDELFSRIGERNAYVYILFTIEPKRLTQIKNELISYGIDVKNIISCSAAHYFMHKEEIGELYDRLEDEDSKRHFEAFLRCRMFGELIPESNMIRGMQYFSVFEFQKLDMNEIYVDAGAFVGDTLEKFLFEKFGTFRNYYAFEPYRESYRALGHRIKRLKNEWGISDKMIITENKALDVKSGNAVMNDALDAVGAVVESASEDANDTGISVNTVRLDDYFANREYTTLKADIEGKEIDMLCGGRSTIRKYGAKLAISIYHRPKDILDIPKQILEINPDYKFNFRCHMPDGSDSILYAYL